MQLRFASSFEKEPSERLEAVKETLHSEEHQSAVFAPDEEQVREDITHDLFSSSYLRVELTSKGQWNDAFLTGLSWRKGHRFDRVEAWFFKRYLRSVSKPFFEMR